MKRIVFSILLPLFIFGALNMADVSANPQNTQPEYAKWGNLAMRQASQKYTVIDYQYLGKKQLAADRTDYQFKFWVRQHAREFGLRVSVLVNPQTEQVVDFQFRETSK